MPEPLARERVRGPAVPAFINTAQDVLSRVLPEAPEVGPADSMRFELAVVEVVGNAVEHAQSGDETGVELDFEIEVHSGLLLARLYEIGAEPFHLPAEPNQMPADAAESGRGLALARQLLSTISCERRDESNLWTLTRRLGGAEG